MKENWLALFLCIEKEMSIDKSLAKMKVVYKGGRKQMKQRSSKYSDKDIANILELKNQGRSYREIGEILGMTADQASGAVRMYKGRMKATRTPTKVVQVAL